MKTVFLRALNVVDKAAALRARGMEASACSARRFEVDPTSFALVPRSPFAYWASDAIRRLFPAFPQFASDGRRARFGVSSKNDFRYLRLWWEPPVRASEQSEPKPVWRLLAKGGAHAPFYADVHLFIKWGAEMREIEAELLSKYTFLDKNADMHLLRSNPYGH